MTRIFPRHCSIHDTQETFATETEVKVFHSALSKFVGSKFGIQCAKLKLCSIQLPIVSVDQAGRVSKKAFCLILILSGLSLYGWYQTFR